MKNINKKVRKFMGSHKFYKIVMIVALSVFALDFIVSLILGNFGRAFDNVISFIWCASSFIWYTMYYNLRQQYEPETTIDLNGDNKISPENPF